MKSLKEALIDYDISQLQSLALKRGLAFPGARSREALDAFVDELLAPASIAIAVNDLSADELAALKHLLNNGGFVEARAFSRRFGAVRAMGSNRLLREKPWESPANPAEGLWYRGLIFKGFHHTLQGPEEIIFIPGDLQPVLPVAPPQTPPFRVGLAADPAHVYPAAPLAREDVFTLLAYLQSNFVRLAAGDSFPADHRRAVCDQFSLFQTTFRAGRGDDPSAAGQLQAERDSWFEFILHTTRRLDFLRRQGQRLKLNINAVKAWLQSAPADQLRQVQHTWRADPTWNDLRHLPGLHPKDTGWENSPLLARSKILHYLSQLPPGEWVAITAFTQAIKRAEPDFQRPGSDYTSWYIYDANGEPLMGFEHWDEVEGGLIEHFIGATLFAMGVVDLGAPGDGLPPAVFRVTAAGRAFLQPDSAPVPPPPANPASLKVNPQDFTVRVPAGASLYDRFQLARFARLLRREAKGVRYKIDRQSYRQALAQSITLEQILAFLNRATGARVPLPLVDAMRAWDRRTGAVSLDRLTVLRVTDTAMLAELAEHPQLGPLLGPPLGPKALLVPEKNLAAARKLLRQLGYLEE